MIEAFATNGANHPLDVGSLPRRAMKGTGWRSVSIVAIDEVWSALRFRPTAPVGSRLRRSPR